MKKLLITALLTLGMHAATYRDPSLSDAQALTLAQAAIESALATTN